MSEFDNNSEFPEPEQAPSESQADTMLASPKLVSPARGFYWLERGLSDVVMPQFKNWFVAGLAYVAIFAILELIDSRLNSIAQVLNPIFMAGGLLGAHNAFRKQKVSPFQFFKAFTHPSKLYLVFLIILQTLLLGAAFLIIGLIVGFDSLTSIDMQKFYEPEEMAYRETVIKILQPAGLIILISIVAFFLATWFAPALIVLQKVNPFSALAKSFIGGLKNILAFIVFLLVIIIIGIVLILIFLLIGVLLSVLPVIIQALLMLSAMAIFLAVFTGITYIGYREVFLGDEGVKKEVL